MKSYKTPKPMKWHVYVGRTSLDIPLWLRRLDIRTYKALCDWCEANNIVAPGRNAVREHLDAMLVKKTKAKPKETKAPKKQKTSKPIKPKKKESGGTEKAADDDMSEQRGDEGAV